MAHILIIEDDDQFRGVLLRVLSQDRHQVVLANATADGLQCSGP